MYKKPWPIVVLALLHISEPIVKLLFYSYYWNRPISYLLTAQSLREPYTLFMYFFAFPIAGFAILAVKRWSLFVFTMIEILNLAGHLHNHALAPQYFPVSLIIAATLINFLVVSYFLIPAVRVLYVYPKFRWWESQPRYQVRWEAYVTQGGKTHTVFVINISQGGLFFAGTDLKFQQNKLLRVNFSVDSKQFTFYGRIKHNYQNNSLSRFGIKFAPLQKKSQEKLKTYLTELDKQGVERRPPRENLFLDFWNWLLLLLTTGKGVIPRYKR